MLNDRVLTAPVSEWNYNMSECVPAAKCLLLNAGGTAVIGQISRGDTQGYIAWSPLPKRDKTTERRMGYL